MTDDLRLTCWNHLNQSRFPLKPSFRSISTNEQPMALAEDKVRESLKQVIDPELFVISSISDSFMWWK